MRKKSTILTIMLLVLATLFLTSCNKTKGGEDSLTVFDVDTDEVEVMYNNQTVSLKGGEHKKFIDVIKDISKGESVKVDDDIEYDMVIDFKNGYVAKISSEKNIFWFDNEEKKISDENMRTILKFVEK